ncbi:MAG: TPM domain-containing protein [Rhizobiaceae bacterium]
MRGRIISDADHRRVAAAIRAAETGTSGEIYCVVARTSASYFAPAAFMLAAATVVLGPIVAWVANFWWIEIPAIILAVAQLVALASALLMIWVFPALRIHFVPKSMRYSHAHDNAVRQFLSRNIHVTTERTGVLIFVSLAERYAEVVADAGINQKVPQHQWNTLVEALVRRAAEGRIADGFIDAVEAVGALLAGHFPARAVEPNELDDHVAEI